MRKTNRIRLTESQLHRVIKESVKAVLKEGQYMKGYNDHGDVLDDNAYIRSYDYIVDSVINGNLSRAQELYKENVRDPFEFMEFLDEFAPQYKEDVIKAVRGAHALPNVFA